MRTKYPVGKLSKSEKIQKVWDEIQEWKVFLKLRSLLSGFTMARADVSRAQWSR